MSTDKSLKRPLILTPFTENSKRALHGEISSSVCDAQITGLSVSHQSSSPTKATDCIKGFSEDEDCIATWENQESQSNCLSGYDDPLNFNTDDSVNVRWSESESESNGSKRKFLKKWKSLFPFLEYDNQKNVMFCKVCCQFAEGCHKGIPFISGTNNFRASSIQYHEKSAVHAKYVQKQDGVISNVEASNYDVLETHYIQNEKLIHVLKSVYFIVKTKSPYTYFPLLCETQKKEGIDVGAAYTSHHKVVPNFAKYIAMAFEKELSKRIRNVEMFSLVLDSSFERSAESHKLVYVKYLENEREKTVFIGVIDSKGNDHHGIFENLNNLFTKINLDKWTEKLVYIITDGVSTCNFSYKAFIDLLKQKCSKHFAGGIHCLSHKLELSCKDVFQNHVSVKLFASLIWDIYWYYARLFEEQKHLKHISKELDVLIGKFGNLPKKKFVTFYFDSLEAVNLNWVFLVRLLKTERHALNLDDKTIKAGMKILSLISRSSFIYKLALMLDIFASLKKFAQIVQKEDILPYMVFDELKKLDTCIEKALRGEGPYASQFNKEMVLSSCKFRNVTIKVDFGMQYILQELKDLCPALISHLRSLMNDLSLLKNSVIFNSSIWPCTEDLKEYGNSEIMELAVNFQTAEQKDLVLSQWCLLKTSASLCFPKGLRIKPKLAIQKMIRHYDKDFPSVTNMLIKVLLMSFGSSEIEKGYHEMNLIKSSERSTLSVASLHNSMIIAMHGPEQCEFDPAPSLELWLSDCSRRYSKRTRCRKRRGKKATNILESEYMCCIDPSDTDIL